VGANEKFLIKLERPHGCAQSGGGVCHLKALTFEASREWLTSLDISLLSERASWDWAGQSGGDS